MSGFVRPLPSALTGPRLLKLATVLALSLIHIFYIAGGVESMTRAPYSLPKNSRPFGPSGNVTAYDTTLGWRYPNPKICLLYTSRCV